MGREPPLLGGSISEPQFYIAEADHREGLMTAYDMGLTRGLMWGMFWGAVTVVAVEVLIVKYAVVWPG